MAAGKLTIWRLVHRCAQELTTSGQTPFSRGELIQCIQRIDPEYGPDSINPIIQGVTDNLKGGAPGAVGKNILHSVSRGQFVLLSPWSQVSEVVIPEKKLPRCNSDAFNSTELHNGESIFLNSLEFCYICDLEPERNQGGAISELCPQHRFDNHQALPLNRYGSGPFCKFRIPNSIEVCGVYAILVDGVLKYIGECQNLSTRYNMGYGNISPRNCFRGGQETNCRVNNLILRSKKSNSRVTLWFHKSVGYKDIERILRANLQPQWNRA